MAVIAIRLPNELIDQIDEWGAERGMTRSESIRRWIKNGVDERWRPLKQKPASRTQTRAKVAALAAETLDRHTDRSAPPEEQASRKRRLLKGPKEFREIRKAQMTMKTRPRDEAEGRYQLAKMRRSIARGQTKYSAGGREKRQTRPAPSMPTLKCLLSNDTQGT